MPRRLPLALPLIALGLLGCGQQSMPTDPLASANAPLPSAPAGVSSIDSIAGAYTIRIDTATLQATVTPVREAANQPPQALSYDLDISGFLTAKSLVITSVERDSNGDLKVTFEHSHPFPAVDFALPISGTNRADLGYTGRLLLQADLELSEVAANTFFGDVVVDPRLVVDADGYIDPGDLLTDPASQNTNLYPYVLLADDGEDNRSGIPNGGPTGNFDGAIGGWQRSNVGPEGNGWTGYDFVHGGQTVTNSFTLSSDRLTGRVAEFKTWLVAKYTDPRGRGGRTLRFPPEPANPLDFAYRAPFAALDGGVWRCDPVDFTTGDAKFSTMPIASSLRDWDAASPEATGSDLSGETDVELIQVGGSGMATVEVDAPDLATNPVGIIPSAGNSGRPGDELRYLGTLTNDLGTAAPGDYYALMRAVDPENADPFIDNYHFGVDPETLVPSPSRSIAPITYQVLPYTIVQSMLPPEITAVMPGGTVGAPCATVTFSATATNSPTSWSWDFGGGAIPNTSTNPAPMVELGSGGSFNGSVTASNAAGSSAPFPFSFTVGSPSAPSWATHHVANTLGTSNDVDWTAIISHNGNLAVGYNLGNGGAEPNCCDAMIAQSTIPNPTLPSHWVASAVDNGQFQGQHMSGLDYNGRLVLVWQSYAPGGQGLRVALANVTVPNGTGDWTKYNVENGFFGETDMQVVNGVLGISYGIGFGAQLGYARALNSSPASSGEWSRHTAAFTGGHSTSLTTFNGNPAIAYREDATGHVRLAQANVPTPAIAADWTQSIVAPNGTTAGFSNANSLAVDITGGRLAVVYANRPNFKLRFALANIVTPLTPTDWTSYDIDVIGDGPGDLGGDLDIINYDGRLAISYRWDTNRSTSGFNSALKVARALNCSPAIPADWSTVLVESDIPGLLNTGMCNGITIHEGKLAVSSIGLPGIRVSLPNGVW